MCMWCAQNWVLFPCHMVVPLLPYRSSPVQKLFPDIVCLVRVKPPLELFPCTPNLFQKWDSITNTFSLLTTTRRNIQMGGAELLWHGRWMERECALHSSSPRERISSLSSTECNPQFISCTIVSNALISAYR